jgi:hypothetical protein
MPVARHRWDPVCDPPTGLVRPVPLDPTGRAGPTRGQARGSSWRRTSHGLYVPSAVDPAVVEQRILEQSMRLVSGGAVTGWASLRLHGGAFFDGLGRDGRTLLPVPLNCSPLHQIHRQPGDDLRRDILLGREITMLYDVPCTVAVRATFDAVRYAVNLREAVVALDMAFAAEITSLSRIREYLGPHQAWTGIDQCRPAVALADEWSRSPQETRLRLVWQLDAGRPRPLANRPIFDENGRLLGYPDLLDPENQVVGEYDGDDHRAPLRHSADVDREALFRDHGLEVFRVTGHDLRPGGRLVDRIHASYRRAREAPRRRTWTLQPPPWWTPEPSLDERLAAKERLSRPYGAAS